MPFKNVQNALLYQSQAGILGCSGLLHRDQYDSYHGRNSRGYNGEMKVDKLSISLESDLSDQVREAARRAGTGLSSWIAGAAAARLRSEALGEFLTEWEKKHGAFTSEELSRAERELGIGTKKRPRR